MSNDLYDRLVNKARNEEQQSLLLSFVLNRTMLACNETVQHARELQNPKTKRRKNSA